MSSSSQLAFEKLFNGGGPSGVRRELKATHAFPRAIEITKTLMKGKERRSC